jgi:nicotinate-nucleotide adenylyltransferase
VLLFGGSFNPIHHGHLIVSRFVAELSGIPRIILIPGASPPHKLDQPLAPAQDRLAMCRLATADDPQFEVSEWEILRPGPNYTIYTVQHFTELLGPDAEICWLIGMDSLNELHSWHRVAQLVDACTMVSAARPGALPPDVAALSARFSPPQVEKLLSHVIQGPRIDIAGRDIRARVQAGRSVRYLVPEAVRQYVDERGLYRQA